jgi:hypothetical protein
VDIKEIARKYMWAQTDAWQNGNLNAFDDIEDQNVIFHYLPQMNEIPGGLEGHKQHVVDMQKIFSNHKVHDVNYIAGERHIFSFIASGFVTIIGQRPGWPPPTSKEIPWDQMFMCRVKSNKVVEVWNYFSLKP